MSDNWISVIFENSYYIPSKDKQIKAEKYLKEIAPHSQEIKTTVYDRIQFFNAGANFESVYCPFCNTELTIDWWQEKMDKDFNESFFLLNEYDLPCCKNKSNLHNLKYSFAQGFGKYILEVMNPKIDELEEEQKKMIEDIFGEKIRVVYVHL